MSYIIQIKRLHGILVTDVVAASQPTSSVSYVPVPETNLYPIMLESSNATAANNATDQNATIIVSVI